MAHAGTYASSRKHSRPKCNHTLHPNKPMFHDNALRRKDGVERFRCRVRTNKGTRSLDTERKTMTTSSRRKRHPRVSPPPAPSHELSLGNLLVPSMLPG